MASPAVLTSLLLLGIIGLFGTILSVVLMVVLRQSSIVRTSKKHPTPYTPSNPSYHTTLNLVFDGDFEWGRNEADAVISDQHISPVRDFGLTPPKNAPTFTVSPLREYPFAQPGHGHMTTDAKVFVMSLGTDSLGHINNTAINNPFFTCSVSTQCEIDNFIITTEDNTNIKQTLALAGASGPQCIVSSVDGLRMYVGYVSPNPDPTKVGGTIAYGKQVSRVRIFTRDPTSITDTVSPESSTNTVWAASSQFFISNPGGSHVFDDEIRPYVIPGAKHDQFGGVMACTRHINSGNRWLAVRAQVATKPEEGAMIFLFEEDSAKGQILRFRLQVNVAAMEPFLDVSAMTTFGFTDPAVRKMVRWEALSQNFGEALAFGNDMLLVSLHTGVLTPSDVATTPRIKQGVKSVVLWFQKSESKDPAVDSFILGGAIPAQLNSEHFGASVALDYTGRLALIGAPALPTDSLPGSGGNVYAFRFDETKRAWTKTDTWAAPAEDPLSFGYWMAVDPFFNAVAVSGNHDNRDSSVPSQATGGSVNQPDANQPRGYIVAIDRSTLTLKKDKVGTIEFLYYPTDTGAGAALPYWIDQSFRPTSLHVLKVSDNTDKVYRVQVITSSVLNGVCGVYTCKAQSL